MTVEMTESHRQHAMECNNLAWALSESTHRTPLQNDEMLHAAHASAYHWARIGTDLHRARARMLLGTRPCCARDGHDCLGVRQESFEYLAAHNPPDWEMAFAHAVLAHAAFAAGEVDLHRRHFASANELGRAIADPEDREIFFKMFNVIPAP